MYWEKILDECLNKDNPSYDFLFTSMKEQKTDTSNKQKNKSKTSMKKYYLGDDFNNTYLTEREAQCMSCLIKGFTLQETAIKFDLSPRTVEFYVKNIKKKLSCHSKSTLIGKVMESDFVKYVDEFK